MFSAQPVVQFALLQLFDSLAVELLRAVLQCRLSSVDLAASASEYPAPYD